jgi:hypothetical protein
VAKKPLVDVNKISTPYIAAWDIYADGTHYRPGDDFPESFDGIAILINGGSVIARPDDEIDRTIEIATGESEGGN